MDGFSHITKQYLNIQNISFTLKIILFQPGTLRWEANTSELGVPKTHNNQMIEIT